MSPKKKHKLLFALSFLILLPIVLEWNFLSVTSPEIITNQISYGSGRVKVHKLYTDKGRIFRVNKILYDYTGWDDTIQVTHTTITNRLQSVTAYIFDRDRTFKLGFLNSSFGLITIPAIMLGSFLSIIFYNYINPPGRSQLAWFTLVLSISQVIFYLLL